jgi:hypothetical protein
MPGAKTHVGAPSYIGPAQRAQPLHDWVATCRVLQLHARGQLPRSIMTAPACKSAKHASTLQAPLAHRGRLLLSTAAPPKQSTRQALELQAQQIKKVTSKSDAANHWSDERQLACLQGGGRGQAPRPQELGAFLGCP